MNKHECMQTYVFPFEVQKQDYAVTFRRTEEPGP